MFMHIHYNTLTSSARDGRQYVIGGSLTMCTKLGWLKHLVIFMHVTDYIAESEPKVSDADGVKFLKQVMYIKVIFPKLF